jgi:hypothetical protein
MTTVTVVMQMVIIVTPTERSPAARPLVSTASTSSAATT